MKFVPPFDFPEMPKVNFDDLSKVDNKKTKKYTEKYKYNPEIEVVHLEDSEIGKIKRELECQTEVMRNYTAKQEENRRHYEAKAKKDASERFRRDATIAIISAIISSFATFVCDNYGTTIIGYIIGFFQN